MFQGPGRISALSSNDDNRTVVSILRQLIDVKLNDGADNGTEQTDITHFSLEEPVEKTDTLIAVHNLNEEDLAKTLDLGGFPMPSIAVVKADQGHTQYGDISVVFGRDTIDPQKSADNKVYGGDAWTPTKPTAESMMSVMSNERVLNELAQSNPDLLTKVKNFVSRMIADMKAVLSTVSGRNAEAKLMKDNIAEWQKMSDMLDRAVEKLSKTRNCF